MDSRVPDFPSWRFVWACSLLGFSLAGFFDGILLHQILQWHHLLIALEGAAFADMRVQILADGLFHLFMYVLAFVGLWLLWRARSEFVQPCADKPALAYSLIGFGTWHVIDAFVVHWMLGFHRIRMDADNLLLWDLIWLVLFGVIPLAVGWMMRGGGGGRKLYPGTAAIVLALAWRSCSRARWRQDHLPTPPARWCCLKLAPAPPSGCGRYPPSMPVWSGSTPPVLCGRSIFRSLRRPGACMETAPCW